MTWTAYWLEQLSPHEYPLLLLAPVPLRALIGAAQPKHLVVATYQRDSLWVNGMQLTESPPVRKVDEQRLVIELGAEVYRYSRAAMSHVQWLFDHPMGTIQIHRMMSPQSFPEELASLRALIR
jgi:hypothetical protein